MFIGSLQIIGVVYWAVKYIKHVYLHPVHYRRATLRRGLRSSFHIGRDQAIAIQISISTASAKSAPIRYNAVDSYVQFAQWVSFISADFMEVCICMLTKTYMYMYLYGAQTYLVYFRLWNSSRHVKRGVHTQTDMNEHFKQI